jgi:ribonuclease HI
MRSSSGTKHLFESRDTPPAHYLIAHSDGGARGNPGPAGYGVVIQDESGRKVATLSEYLGHQTNNFAEYQGLIAALEYALQHGPKALKLISDSELLVRQIKGIYKVKNATLKDLHTRAKELIAQLDWFSIGHALREHNQEADRLANEAMDKGMGRSVARGDAVPGGGKDRVGASPARPSPTVAWGPCCFCALDIQPSDVDPCRVQVTTAGGKWQTWSCHATCFKQRIKNPPTAPTLFDPAHF